MSFASSRVWRRRTCEHLLYKCSARANIFAAKVVLQIGKFGCHMLSCCYFDWLRGAAEGKVSGEWPAHQRSQGYAGLQGITHEDSSDSHEMRLDIDVGNTLDFGEVVHFERGPYLAELTNSSRALGFIMWSNCCVDKKACAEASQVG